MIRLPQPTTVENYVQWARQIVSTLELQQIQNEQKTTSSTKEAEDKAEAKAWFNG
tara:strand:+ start:43 stop:207 length:165 start_codon:yes stop_codon:yes gene_type:complete